MNKYVQRAIIIVLLAAALLFVSDRLTRSPEPPVTEPGEVHPLPPPLQPTVMPGGYPLPGSPTPQRPYPPPSPEPTELPEGYQPPPG